MLGSYGTGISQWLESVAPNHLIASSGSAYAWF